MLLHSYPDRFTHEFFIESAHPDRALIEQTWKVVRSSAGRDGFVGLSTEDIAARLPPRAGERKVGAALRALIATGAMTVEPPAMGRVCVRLLAAPARITRELAGERDFDREVLRALWRAVGKRLESGATVDLDGLPPGLGGSMGLVPVLQRLESEQFLTWTRTGAGVRLDARARDAKWLPVDWHQLERRRQAELARLDAMQRYAQTRYCRRAFVLRYFGDPEVRSQCNACDRCLGTTDEAPRTAVPVRAPTRAQRT